MEYIFGSVKSSRSYSTIKIQAKSLEFAIKKFIFMTEDLSKYVEQDIFGEYNCALNIYPVDETKVAKLDKITIPVGIYEKNDDGKKAYKELTKLDYNEILDTDFDKLIQDSIGNNASVPMIEDESNPANQKNEVVLSNLPTVRTNRDFQKVRNEIQKKLMELEETKNELNKQLSLMRDMDEKQV